ncbi:MAG: ERAP1-like C-terminal domain-containing protein [Deltaproteobacteria bacterium]|nr:ERAP1-like C-terminal domain-containing protein [Deltaproteobacteria bacterium]
MGSRPTSPWPAPFRLDPDVAPVRYDVRLRIDPERPVFTGEVAILVDVRSPRWLIHLHADGLEVARARVTLDGHDHPVRAEADGAGHLALVGEAPFPVGRLTIDLLYKGPLPEAPLGVYRAQDQGRWYAFTQLEPLEARRVFPCFDEPRFKVPFGLDIEAPEPMIAVANEPEVEVADARPEDGQAARWRRFSFQDTPPLPTYLVAFAVGELDLAEHPAVSDGRVPFRIVATKDKARAAGFAARVTPRYLEALERWFGSPYPFAKLDQVAVPSFGASGMENPGLITYREALLLLAGDEATADDRGWAEGVIAHELAHMWFGDLVTMAWWDDLWLNEAFATFMGRKAMAEVSPEFRMPESAVRNRFNVMGQDARPNARAIRQPIEAEGDIYNAFDGITYSKGAAVLAMVEGWLGPDVFRDGVRAYLAERAGGTATTGDLMRHLTHAAGGLPVERVVASFADRAGVPVVDVTWSCVPPTVDRATVKVAVRLRQRAQRGLGDTRPAAGPEVGTWSIPVCLTLGTDEPERAPEVHCGVLGEAEETWTRELGACPTWVHPNKDEAGYYRWTAAPRAFPAAGSSDPRLVFGELDNLRAEAEAQRTPVARYLDRAVALAREADLPDVLLTSLVHAAGFVSRALPDGGDDPRYRRLVGRLLERQAVALDLGGPRATLADKQRQPVLVRALGAIGDRRVRKEAAAVTDRWLRDVERGTRTTRIDVASHYVLIHVRALGRDAAGGKAREALWQRLRRAFDRARDATERDLIIEALAAFEEPALVTRAYELLLDGTLRAQDARTLRGATSGRPEIVKALWDWLALRFDVLVDKLGAKTAPGLPNMAAGFCSEEDAAKVEAFFEGKKAVIPSGLEHHLKNTLDGIRKCALFRRTFEGPVASWLDGR